MNIVIRDFIGKSLMEMIENNVNLKLLYKNRVNIPNDNNFLNGYFNDYPLEFSCAMLKPQKEWIPIFLHEYCHFKQWKEKSILWEDLKKIQNKLWKWIDHKIELDSEELREVISITINIELDCEKRVVKLIKKNKLNYINIEEYINSANTYIGFYHILEENRKWYIKAPYEFKKIRNTMPNVFLNNYDVLPVRSIDLVNKCCF